MKDTSITSKQMGDAAEMLVAGNLTLRGNPSFTVPAHWPTYDVVAAPPGKRLQTISVKCRGRSNINFRPDEFDWLAIVLTNKRHHQFFIIPSAYAKKNSKEKESAKAPGLRTINYKTVPAIFAKYKDNFQLVRLPSSR